MLSYNIDPKCMKDVLDQVMFAFPVWWLHFSDNDVVVNLHELLLPGTLESLLSVQSEAVVSSSTMLSRHSQKKLTPGEQKPRLPDPESQEDLQ